MEISFLDNRTHSMTGYNIFLTGIADGEERDFVIAISEKQQEKYKFLIRIVVAAMMKAGWMRFVFSIDRIWMSNRLHRRGIGVHYTALWGCAGQANDRRTEMRACSGDVGGR